MNGVKKNDNMKTDLVVLHESARYCLRKIYFQWISVSGLFNTMIKLNLLPSSASSTARILNAENTINKFSTMQRYGFIIIVLASHHHDIEKKFLSSSIITYISLQ